MWDARELPINTDWNKDGPLLPIEYARESADGRITLVLADVEKRVESLWALMEVGSIDEAKMALAQREGVSDSNIKYSIGFWDKASNCFHGRLALEIGSWANNMNIDGVVWTNLKYGFKSSRDVMPEYPDLLDHFQSLSKDQRSVAEKYVRKTPIQVRTEYRTRLENDFGWIPN